jgi:hypothetical protein
VAKVLGIIIGGNSVNFMALGNFLPLFDLAATEDKEN